MTDRDQVGARLADQASQGGRECRQSLSRVADRYVIDRIASRQERELADTPDGHPLSQASQSAGTDTEPLGGDPLSGGPHRREITLGRVDRGADQGKGRRGGA